MREIVRCKRCSLNQYMTHSTYCRRCGRLLQIAASLPTLSESIFHPRSIHVDVQTFHESFCFYHEAWKNCRTRGRVSLRSVTRTAVSKLKKASHPSIGMIERIAESMGIPIRWLLTPPRQDRADWLFTCECLLQGRQLNQRQKETVLKGVRMLSDKSMRRAG